MKIGISTTMIQRGRSGVAQHLFALTRALFEAAGRRQFCLFVLKEDLPLFDFARGQAELVAVDEKFRGPLANIGWHQAILPGIARARGLDVLHVPSYRRLLWPRPCALVATIHDLAPFHLPHKYDPLRMFYGRVIVRRLAQRQNLILTVSESTAEDVRRFFGVPTARIRVAHNGIDHGRFSPGDPGKARGWIGDKFGIRRPYFCYVARLEHPGKNHLRLIEAFGRFKKITGANWELVLAGSDWHGADVARQAANSSPDRESIRLLGFVAGEFLPKLYRAAEALVFPSLFEGFGFPPLEAMACGCPVISSTRGALAEAIGGAALAIDPEDAEAMAQAMARMASDAELRERLRRAGIRQAARFDWRRTAALVMEAYDLAAGSEAPRRSWTPEPMRIEN